MKRKLKKPVVYVLCSILFVAFSFGLYYLSGQSSKSLDNKPTYIDKTVFSDEEKPVLNSDQLVMRPYYSDKVEIISNFYENDADISSQQNSIIYYDKTYMQSTGIIYGSDNTFDVICIYDGEVISIDDSDLLGKKVEIRHSNDIISVYQLLGEVDVTLNSQIKQGDVIGKSGISNIVSKEKQQLYFEILVHGQMVNGEKVYGKKLSEL